MRTDYAGSLVSMAACSSIHDHMHIYTHAHVFIQGQLLFKEIQYSYFTIGVINW